MKSWKYFIALLCTLSIAGCSLEAIEDCTEGDLDGDGANNCDDKCPKNPKKIAPGTDKCGCGLLTSAIDDLDGCTCYLRENDQEIYVCNDDEPETDESQLDENNHCRTGTVKAGKEPGICGCDKEDIDSDNDGTMDCKDECPQNPQKSEKNPDACGCGLQTSAPDDHDGCTCLMIIEGEKTTICNEGEETDESKLDENGLCREGTIKANSEPGICGCDAPDDDLDDDGTIDCVQTTVTEPDPPPIDDPIVEPVIDPNDLDSDKVENDLDPCPYNPDIFTKELWETIGKKSCASYKNSELHIYPGGIKEIERTQENEITKIVIHGVINLYYTQLNADNDLGSGYEIAVNPIMNHGDGVINTSIHLPENIVIIGEDNAELNFLKDEKRVFLTEPLFDELNNANIKDLLINIDFYNNIASTSENHLYGGLSNSIKGTTLENVGYSGSFYTKAPNTQNYSSQKFQPVGGLVAEADENSSFTDIYLKDVSVTIPANTYFSAGGLVGNYAGQKLTLKTGNVNVNIDTENRPNMSVDYINIGGLIGEMSGNEDGKNITISNLTIENVNMNTERNCTSCSMGGIVGKQKGNAYYQINDVNINNIKCGSNCGGAVGNVEGNLSLSADNIKVENVWSLGDKVGGIVGNINNEFNSNSLNAISIIKMNVASGKAGGIVGWAKKFIVNELRGGEIIDLSELKGNDIGGLIGWNEEFEINKIERLKVDKLSGNSNVGGLSGQTSGSFILKNVDNIEIGTVSGHSYVAGILGYCPSCNLDINKVKISTSSIVSKGGNSGAIFGQVTTKEIFNISDLTNTVTSIECPNSYCGGLFGLINANYITPVVFTNITSDVAEISGNNYIGGFGGGIQSVNKMTLTKIDNHIGLIKTNVSSYMNYFGGLLAVLNIYSNSTGGAIDFHLIRSNVEKFDFSSLRNSSAFIAQITSGSNTNLVLNMSDVLSVIHEAIKDDNYGYSNAGFIYNNELRGIFNANRIVSLAQLPPDSITNAIFASYSFASNQFYPENFYWYQFNEGYKNSFAENAITAITSEKVPSAKNLLNSKVTESNVQWKTQEVSFGEQKLAVPWLEWGNEGGPN